jgi:hypothetical protein
MTRRGRKALAWPVLAGILFALVGTQPREAIGQITPEGPPQPAESARLQHTARTHANSGSGCVDSAECFDGIACTLDLCTSEGTCVNPTIPDCVSCTVTHDCSPVELVFVIDTSGSMRDEASALCAGIATVVAELDAIGIEVHHSVLGVTQTPQFGFNCITDNVVNMLGGTVPGNAASCPFPGSTFASESWGPATAIVADRYPWMCSDAEAANEECTRVIIPISDEGACNGDQPDGCNDPGDDRNAVENAITAAEAKSCTVSPIAGTTSGACTIGLMKRMAAGTGGTTFQTKNPKTDFGQIIHDIVMGICTIDDSCDDGLPCTENDVCRGGLCMGRSIPGCRLCVTDADCNDNNYCTDDACGPGRCEYTPSFEEGVVCCRPFDGKLTPIDDNDPCTLDNCNTGNGQVTHPPAPAGVECDDERVCTAMDACDGQGHCSGEDVGLLECASNDDCFGQLCDEPSGHCVCTEAPELCIVAVPGELANETCYGPNEELVVNVTLSNSGSKIAGAQFYLGYDPAVFQFASIAPGQDVDPTSPFVAEVSRTVNEVEGRIFYAVGVSLGGEGTRGPAVLATLRFLSIGDCDSDQFCFVDANPQTTRLVDEFAQSVSFTQCCSEVLTANGPPPVLTCPSNRVVNADAGSASATVFWPMIAATDGCDGPSEINCFGESSEGVAVDQLAFQGGSIPSGVTAFTCTATDSCGATGVCNWSVEVRELNAVRVDLQLSPIMGRGPLQRCIEFQLYSSCEAPPVTVTRTVEFGQPRNIAGRASDLFLEVPADAYFCMTARDIKHTLRSTTSLSIQNTHYAASFAGDQATGGNWLVNGNLDGNSVLDSTDDAILMTQWQTPRDPNTPCGTPGFHADINGDGVVNLTDRGFIQQNSGATNMVGCCGSVAAAGPDDGYSALSDSGLEELERMDIPVDPRADVNRNGVVDDLDVVELLMRERRRSIQLPTGD